MNISVIVGHIKEEPVLEVTQSGLNLCNLIIETVENDNKPGELLKVTLWKQVADYIKENGQIGDLISIKGRLKANNYTKDNGEIIYRPEIVADKVTLIDIA